MRTHLTTLLKSISLAIALVAMMTLGQGVARADEVTVTGSTTGSSTVPQLQFAGNLNFTGGTQFGIGAFTGPNSLGTFFLQTSPAQLVAGTFTLNVTFSVPSGIVGGQATSYNATIVGSVSPNINIGGVDIDFTNPSQTFFFNDGVNSGSFTVVVDSLHVQSGQSANLEAGLSGSQQPIPEPATMLLLGTGLAGVAAKIRKRRKVAKE